VKSVSGCGHGFSLERSYKYLDTMILLSSIFPYLLIMTMPMSSLLCYCAYIMFFLSSVSAFTVTFDTPTQCDPFTVSWTGKCLSCSSSVLFFNFTMIIRRTSTFLHLIDSCSLALLPFPQSHQLFAHLILIISSLVHLST